MFVIFHFPYTNIFGFDFSFWELNAKLFYYFVLWYQLSLWQERPQIQGCATWSSGKELPFSLRPRAFRDASRAFCGEGSALWQHAHVLALVTVCLNLCTCGSCFWTHVLVVLICLSVCLAGLSLPKSDLSKIVFDKNIHCFDCTVQVQTL